MLVWLLSAAAIRCYYYYFAGFWIFSSHCYNSICISFFKKYIFIVLTSCISKIHQDSLSHMVFLLLYVCFYRFVWCCNYCTRQCKEMLLWSSASFCFHWLGSNFLCCVPSFSLLCLLATSFLSLTRFNKIQNTKNTMKKDGISSLTYRLVQVKKYPLYTNISVEIGKPPPRPIKG